MPAQCSDASTDVPDDEEYLTEWDEWSEIEKGHGPKASWNGDVWSTMSGVFQDLPWLRQVNRQ